MPPDTTLKVLMLDGKRLSRSQSDSSIFILILLALGGIETFGFEYRQYLADSLV